MTSLGQNQNHDPTSQNQNPRPLALSSFLRSLLEPQIWRVWLGFDVSNTIGPPGIPLTTSKP